MTIDREKVIRGLECCTKQSPSYCRECPYKETPDNYPFCVHMRLQVDALAVMRELEGEEDDGK